MLKVYFFVYLVAFLIACHSWLNVRNGGFVVCPSCQISTSALGGEWRITDSNRWPLACHASALASWAISAGRFVGRQGVCCQTRCKSTIFSRNSKHSVAFFASSFHFWRLCLKALSEFWACWFLRDALFEVEAGAWRNVWPVRLAQGCAKKRKWPKRKDVFWTLLIP